MAGLSFVICRRQRVESMTVAPGRSLYLDLGEQHRYFERNSQMRFTPPVQVIYALAAAIEELEVEGGVAARHQRYQECWRALDSGMQGLGFRRLLPEHQLSRILTSYIEPTHEGYSYERLHDLLYDRGFTIYPGKGGKRATFRLANMGNISPGDMDRFIVAMRQTVAEMGLDPLYRD
jgi:2-aminoethylphosphonate-pyruvate transaminase